MKKHGNAIRIAMALALALWMAATAFLGISEEKPVSFRLVKPEQDAWPRGASFKLKLEPSEEKMDDVQVKRVNQGKDEEEVLSPEKDGGYLIKTGTLPLDCGQYTVKVVRGEETLDDFSFRLVPETISFDNISADSVELESRGAYKLQLPKDGTLAMHFGGEIPYKDHYPQIKLKKEKEPISINQKEPAAWEKELNEQLNKKLASVPDSIEFSIGYGEGKDDYIVINVTKAEETPAPNTAAAIPEPGKTPEPKQEPGAPGMNISFVPEDRFVVERDEKMLVQIRLDTKLEVEKGEDLRLEMNGQQVDVQYEHDENAEAQEANNLYVFNVTEKVKESLDEEGQKTISFTVIRVSAGKEDEKTEKAIQAVKSEPTSAPTYTPTPIPTPEPTPTPTPTPTPGPIQIEGIGKKYAFLDQKEHNAEFHVSGQEGELIKIQIPSRTEEGTETTKDVKEGKVSFTYKVLSDAKQINAFYQKYPQEVTTYPIYLSEEDVPKDAEEGKYLLLLNAKYTVQNDEINEDTEDLIVKSSEGLKLSLSINGKEVKGEKGDALTSFKLNGAGRLKSGDQIILEATDDFGCKDSKPIDVESVNLEKISASWLSEELPNVVNESGKIYIDNVQNPQISLEVTAHKNRNIVLTVVEQPELQPVSGSTDAQGKCKLTLPLTGWEEGLYKIAVSYQDDQDENDGATLQWKSTLIIDTHTQPIEMQDRSVREGATEISIQCESNATVSLLVNDELRNETKADEKGNAVLKTKQRIQRDDHIVIKARDILNHETETKEDDIRVKPADIQVMASDAGADKLYVSSKQSQTAQINGLEEASVNLYLAKNVDNLEDAKLVETVALQPAGDGKGAAAYTVTADSLDGWLEENDAFYLIAQYAQDERADSLPMIYDPVCALEMDDSQALTTATEELAGKTDPHASVQLKVVRNGEEQGSRTSTAGEDGIFTFDLADAQLHAKDQISLQATDAAGNVSQPYTIEVKNSGPRPQMLFLLVAGLILFIFSLLWFRTTKKKVNELEEISKAAEKTTMQTGKKKR